MRHAPPASGGPQTADWHPDGAAAQRQSGHSLASLPYGFLNRQNLCRETCVFITSCFFNLGKQSPEHVILDTFFGSPQKFPRFQAGVSPTSGGPPAPPFWDFYLWLDLGGWGEEGVGGVCLAQLSPNWRWDSLSFWRKVPNFLDPNMDPKMVPRNPFPGLKKLLHSAPPPIFAHRFDIRS